MRPSPLTRALALCLPLLLSACGPAPVQDGGPEEGPPTGESGQEMINGTRVSPAWAVLLDSYGANDEKWQCTGTLIAPRVVLTAATCLFHRGVKDLRQVVTAPYAGGVVQQAARAILHPTFTGDFVSQYNVGLVILDTPINLGSYPLVGFAVNVGYTTDPSNQVWQTMARVDVVEPWIAEQLVLHGGVQPWIGYGITARSTAAFSVKVNFQPAGSPVPAGFVADSGQLYATRANGYRYGWAEDMTADTRDRNSALSPSQEFDTLLLMQKNGKNGMWQIAAPPGVYNVRMVAGDPSYIDSVYNMRFGTLEIFAFQPTEQNHWADRTMEGFFHYGGLLQLENVYGTDLNNKIAFVELTRTGPLP